MAIVHSVHNNISWVVKNISNDLKVRATTHPIKSPNTDSTNGAESMICVCIYMDHTDILN